MSTCVDKSFGPVLRYARSHFANFAIVTFPQIESTGRTSGKNYFFRMQQKSFLFPFRDEINEILRKNIENWVQALDVVAKFFEGLGLKNSTSKATVASREKKLL